MHVKERKKKRVFVHIHILNKNVRSAGRGESLENKHEVEKGVQREGRVWPVHCSVIWPSAWMDKLNIMTLEIGRAHV